MSDLQKQIQDYYAAKQLPAEKVERLLSLGSGAGNANDTVIPFTRRKPWGRLLSAAAAVAVFAFAGIWWTQRDVGRVEYAALPPRVIEFFSGTPELVPASQDKNEVREWLLKKGAPDGFRIPRSLFALESAACQVVDVKGEKAYMSCYWVDQKPDRGIHDLVHLLVARAEDFRNHPGAGPAEVKELDGWSFASWTEGNVIYTLATAAPKEKLMPFLVLSGDASGTRFISTVIFSH